MGMTKFAEWSKLICQCGKDAFYEIKRLRWSQSGGTVTEPAGWRCAACGHEVDTATLIKELLLRQKKAEVDAAQQQLDEMRGRTPSSS